jgi:hypothetical protein
MVTTKPVSWMVLVYRVPREPSAPRIAIWRRLRRVGVAQLADGVVALPKDARTREQLEWVAEEVVEAGGTAMLWCANTLSRTDERALATDMSTARAGEYTVVIAAAAAASEASQVQRRRVLKRLRRELRTIRRRDFFPPPEAEEAAAAVAALATAVEEAVPS